MMTIISDTKPNSYKRKRKKIANKNRLNNVLKYILWSGMWIFKVISWIKSAVYLKTNHAHWCYQILSIFRSIKCKHTYDKIHS